MFRALFITRILNCENLYLIASVFSKDSMKQSSLLYQIGESAKVNLTCIKSIVKLEIAKAAVN